MTHVLKAFPILLLFFLVACSSGDNTAQSLEYIENYVDQKSGVNFHELMDTIENQRNELKRYAAIASEVNSEMDRIMAESGGVGSNSKLKAYIDGLSEEQRNAPQKMSLIANQMGQSMSKAIDVFAIQSAVMVVTEEACNNSKAAEQWQDILFKVNAELTGKLPESTTKQTEQTYWSYLDTVATDFESGVYSPSCEAQKQNTRFMRYANIVLN